MTFDVDLERRRESSKQLLRTKRWEAARDEKPGAAERSSLSNASGKILWAPGAGPPGLWSG